MQPTLYIFDGFRTNNFNDTEILAKFTAIWEKTLAKIENSTVYGVYYDYQSNYKGDYSFATASENPLKNTQKIIPTDGSYKIFTTSKDKVFETWQEIWQLEEQGKLNRTYFVDYEKYLPTGEVEIHIGIE